jgi:hypothetical protein
VDVLVDGEKVGCLPSDAAKDFPLPVGASQLVPYQLHIVREQRLRAKAYILARGRRAGIGPYA